MVTLGSTRGRVLVVDDVQDALAVFAMTIEREGFTVDTATNLHQALAMVRAVTYDVAVVDIDLIGNGTNEDGVEVIKYINNLGEGTLSVILTGAGTENPQFVADMLQVHGAFRFVAKMSLVRPGGSRLLLDAVNAALETRSIRYYGAEDNILDLLASEEKEIWIDRILEVLSPKEGYRGLQRFLDGLFGTFLPILPPRAALAGRGWLAESEGAFAGEFWSKGRGVAIKIRVFRAAVAQEVEPSGLTRLHSYSIAGVSGLVDEIDLRRDDFVP